MSGRRLNRQFLIGAGVVAAVLVIIVLVLGDSLDLFGTAGEQPTATVEVAQADRDNDGVLDADDQCVDQAGPSENKGCPWPDSDGDGVLDKDDACVGQAGPAENNGCPWPDGDGDGIPDKDDACAGQAGPAENNGCPWPDGDGDGIPDKDDACPAQGDAGYGLDGTGCPVPPPDSDNDGVLDNADACPDRGDAGYGLGADGCPLPPPDSDNDGVLDNADACPDRGDAGYGLGADGCPLPPPDSDNDGVLDNADACPAQGDAGYGLGADGCPLPPPDSDNDGVLDDVDACPSRPGPGTADGCPAPTGPAVAVVGGVTAGFDAFVAADGTVYYTDKSTGPVATWSWDFGDGSGSSDQNPTHLYASAGTYTVRLTVKDANGVASTAQGQLTITDEQAAPMVCDFDITLQTEVVPLVAVFTNTSSNAAGFAWNFGNGQTSTAPGPHTITYDAVGTYNVTLVCTDARGNSVTATGWITASESEAAQPLTAGFSANPNRGSAPLSVVLTDISTSGSSDPIVSWSWDFGNGQTSTSRGPHTVQYNVGVYTVSLVVTTQKGLQASATGTVQAVEPVAKPVPGINAQPLQGDAPLTVVVNGTNSGGPVDTWSWDFGNGQTATGQGPHTVVYTTARTYTITLNVTGPGGTGFKTQQIVATTPGALVQAIFSYGQPVFNPDNTATVCFNNNSQGAVVRSVWNIAGTAVDLTSDPLQQVCHVFPGEGTYTVSLGVYGSNPGEYSDTTRRVPVYTSLPAPEAHFSADRTDIEVGGVVRFFDQSVNIVTEWEWDFNGDGTVDSTDQNPSYQFNQAGTYQPLLTVRGPGGSSQATEVVITVSLPSVSCDFSAISVLNVGETGSYSVRIGDSGRNVTYQWTVTKDGQAFAGPASGSDFSVTYTEAGGYVVTVVGTAEDGSTCQHSENVEVRIPGIVCAVGGPTNLLPGALQEYLGTVDGLDGRVPTFEWLLNGQSVGTGGSYSRTWEAGNYTLTFKAQTLDGSQCQATITIVVTGDLLCQLQGNFNVLPGQQGTYNLLVTGLQGRTPSFEWYIDGTLDPSATGSSYAHVWEAGSHTIRAVVLTPDGARCEAGQGVEVGYGNLVCRTPGGTGSPYVNQTVTYTPNVSNASDFTSAGYTITYEWQLIDLSTGAVVATGTGTDFPYTFTTPGGRYRVIYTARVDVDGEIKQCSAPRTITVGSGTFACRDIRILSTPRVPGQAYTYEARVRNPSALALTYTWSNGTTHSGVTGSSDRVSIAWPDSGIYTLSVAVSADDGSSSCNMSIDVKSGEINVDFTVDHTSVQVGEQVCLENTTTWTGSTPPTYTWTMPDGSTTGVEQPGCFTFDTPGEKVFHLRGEMNGLADEQTRTVIVTDKSEIRAQANPEAALVGEPIRFTAEGTNIDETTYKWYIPGVSNPINGKSVTYIFTSAGTYEARVTGTGSLGQLEAKVNVVVSESADIRAAFVPDKWTALAPAEICFTDMSEQQPQLNSWAWDLNGDGTVDSNEQNPCFAYSTAGEWNVTLTVGNIYGLTARATNVVRTYQVGGGGGSWDYTPKPGGEVCFTSSLDEGFSILGWDFGDGGSSDEANPCHVYQEGGDYTVALLVTDGQLQYPIVRQITVRIIIVEEWPQIGVEASCVEGEGGALARFVITNTGGDMFAEDTATVVDAAGNTIDTFTYQLAKGESITRDYAGQGRLTLTTGFEGASTTLEPCGQPASLKSEGVCNAEAGTLTFTITNGGGPMDMGAPYSITSSGVTLESGTTNPLGAGESQSFTVPAPQDGSRVDLSVEGYPDASASAESCFALPKLRVEGSCNADNGTVIFTLTNSGGPMGKGVPYSIIPEGGQPFESGVTNALGSGESQNFTVGPVDESVKVIFATDELVAEAEVMGCYKPGPEETPQPTEVAERPKVCGGLTTDADGFPIVDMNPADCSPAQVARAPWTPLEVGGAVCPDWLLYHTNQTGDWEVFRLGELPGQPGADPNLSHGEGQGVYDVAPTRSPDAEWVAFASNRDGNWEIYIGKADGTFQQRVTYTVEASELDPMWSPDGRHIVYDSVRDGNWDLYMVDVATGEETRLTDNPANDINGFWSPDSTRLLFQSDRDGLWQIYELDLATMKETRLSDGLGDDHDPQYSHDGTLIAFHSHRLGDNGTIFVMNADGSDVKAVSDPAGDARLHVFSDDDTLIAYQSNLDGDSDIYVYELATGATRLVTDNDIEDYAPTWWCHAPIIVFTSDITEDSNLFQTPALPMDAPAIKVEEEAAQLTDEPASDQYPENTPTEENASQQRSLPSPENHKGQ